MIAIGELLKEGSTFVFNGLRHPKTAQRVGRWDIVEANRTQIKVRPSNGTDCTSRHIVAVDKNAITDAGDGALRVDLYAKPRKR